jgi:hypothetical protein
MPLGDGKNPPAKADTPHEAHAQPSQSQTLYDQGGVSVIATETPNALELAVSEPDPILVSVEVDRNQNGQFDRLVDVAYRPQANENLCPQYLIDSQHNTPCGSLSSHAYLKDFSDDLGHRKFVLVLPKKEISFDLPSAKLAFVFRDTAYQHTFFYPVERFQKAIDVPYAIKQVGAVQIESNQTGFGVQNGAGPYSLSEAGSGVGLGFGATNNAEATINLQRPSGATVKRYKPQDDKMWSRRMNIDITRTDAGNQYHFAVNFIVPDPPTGPPFPSPYPFNLVTVYGNQVQNGRINFPNETIPSVEGNWKAGDHVHLEFDLLKEYADPMQGWNLRFCIGKRPNCLPSPNLLISSTDARKPRVDGPHIRVENRSNVDFKNVEVNDSQFGDIKAGAFTSYQTMDIAYKYARVSLSTDSGPLRISPIDYMGERRLDAGNYTYVLTIQEGRLIIECIVD